MRRVITGATATLALATAAGRAATVTTLWSSAGTDGSDPEAGVTIDPAGNLYGTTQTGGAQGLGTAFELPAATRQLTTLATFGQTTAPGWHPRGTLLLDAAGNLYGTAYDGGASFDGTVFELPAATRQPTLLATFTGTNGANPHAGLTADAAGNLYSTTTKGGAGGTGTVFELSAPAANGTRTLTSLAPLNNSTGIFPFAGVTADPAGDLFGTAPDDGPNGAGAVFEVPAGTRAAKVVVAFSNPGAAGSSPLADLIADPAGNLYGTTNDTVFELAAGTGTLTTLARLPATPGTGTGSPHGPLLRDAVGDLFGVTYPGTVFDLPAGSSTPLVLASVGGQSDAGLTADAAGNLYGTTVAGGSHRDGSVFELTGTGFVTTVPEPAAVMAAAVPAAFVRRCRRRR